MSTTRTRIARLAAASVLALGLGALGAGPAFAENPAGWSWSAPDSTVTVAAEDDASLTTIGRGGGIKSVEDGAGTETSSAEDDASLTGVGRVGGVKSVEDGASADPVPQICHPMIAPCGV